MQCTHTDTYTQTQTDRGTEAKSQTSYSHLSSLNTSASYSFCVLSRFTCVQDADIPYSSPANSETSHLDQLVSLAHPSLALASPPPNMVVIFPPHRAIVEHHLESQMITIDFLIVCGLFPVTFI